VALAYGVHEVTLRVTDPEGAFGEVTRLINVEPADLAVLELEKVEIKFNDNPPRFKLKGEIGLPFGVDYRELSPESTMTLALAEIDVLSSSTLQFTVEDYESEEWEFDATPSSAGITNFKISWKDMRFKFKEHDFPVNLDSDAITSSGSLLNVKLKPEAMDTAFSIEVGGLAQISFGSDGEVTASSVPWETDGDEDDGDEDGDQHQVVLYLPFPLLDTTVITFSGGLSRGILVGNHLKGPGGRFCLEGRFDGASFPAGAETMPRKLDLNLTVGVEAYPGSASLGPEDIELKNDKWRVR
jgi:hypothetical protein